MLGWSLVNIAAFLWGFWDYRGVMEDWPGWIPMLTALAEGIAQAVIPGFAFLFIYQRYVLPRILARLSF
jgi:hypothetical protein